MTQDPDRAHLKGARTLTTFERLALILHRSCRVAYEAITPAATLVSMRLDSLDQVEFAVMVEDVFGVDLETVRFQRVRTLGELVFEIERHNAMSST